MPEPLLLPSLLLVGFQARVGNQRVDFVIDTVQVPMQSLLDLMGLFRVWNTKYNSWSIFGQDHLARVLLGWDTSGETHDACLDAMKSMKLFNLYSRLQSNPAAWAEAQVITADADVAWLHCHL